MKKKLLFLCVLVLVFSCLTGCERIPYWPTPWDRLRWALPRLLEVTELHLQIELTVTRDDVTYTLQTK